MLGGNERFSHYLIEVVLGKPQLIDEGIRYGDVVVPGLMFVFANLNVEPLRAYRSNDDIVHFHAILLDYRRDPIILENKSIDLINVAVLATCRLPAITTCNAVV